MPLRLEYALVLLCALAPFWITSMIMDFRWGEGAFVLFCLILGYLLFETAMTGTPGYEVAAVVLALALAGALVLWPLIRSRRLKRNAASLSFPPQLDRSTMVKLCAGYLRSHGWTLRHYSGADFMASREGSKTFYVICMESGHIVSPVDLQVLGNLIRTRKDRVVIISKEEIPPDVARIASERMVRLLHYSDLADLHRL